MEKLSKHLVIYVVLSLIILIFFFVYFVLPSNTIPDRTYQGPGSPFVHPPAG